MLGHSALGRGHELGAAEEARLGSAGPDTIAAACAFVCSAARLTFSLDHSSLHTRPGVNARAAHG